MGKEDAVNASAGRTMEQTGKGREKRSGAISAHARAWQGEQERV
jgi:hypothetical protein